MLVLYVGFSQFFDKILRINTTNLIIKNDDANAFSPHSMSVRKAS